MSGIANTSVLATYAYKQIKSLLIPTYIAGSVYKKGMRPLDAKTEDAVIVISDGDAEQIQSGHLHINVYVQDIDAGTGNLVANLSRIAQIESFDNMILNSLNEGDTDYNFKYYKMTDHYEDEDYTNQHFVGFFIEFKKINY